MEEYKSDISKIRRQCITHARHFIREINQGFFKFQENNEAKRRLPPEVVYLKKINTFVLIRYITKFHPAWRAVNQFSAFCLFSNKSGIFKFKDDEEVKEEKYYNIEGNETQIRIQDIEMPDLDDKNQIKQYIDKHYVLVIIIEFIIRRFQDNEYYFINKEEIIKTV